MHSMSLENRRPKPARVSALRSSKENAMETREPKIKELDDLLDLYSHLHNEDNTLPVIKRIEDV